MKPGTPLDHVFALNVQGLPLEPNQRYEWRLTIDDKGHDDWCLAFNTVAVPPPFAQAA